MRKRVKTKNVQAVHPTDVGLWEHSLKLKDV